MVKLNQKYEIDRKILKYDFTRYSPPEKNPLNTPDSQRFMNIPRKGSDISLLSSYLDKNFDVLRAATGNRYADGNDITLPNLGPSALLCSDKLTTSSGKQLKDFSPAYIVSSMYKLITIPKNTDGLFIGFHRDGVRRQRELTNYKNQRGKIR